MRNELKCECNYRYVVIRHSFCYEIISLSRAMNLFIGKFEFAYESFNLLICSYFVSIASPLSIYFLPFIAIIIIRARTTVDDFHFISLESICAISVRICSALHSTFQLAQTFPMDLPSMSQRLCML